MIVLSLQVFDLASTTVSAAVKSIYKRLEELEGQGFSAARLISDRVSFVLVGDHKRVYNTLQVLESLAQCCFARPAFQYLPCFVF